MAADLVSLYLVRHAAAEERGPRWPDDTLRPLTDRGAKRFAEAAAGLIALEGAPDEIFTSPLVRAAETAALLAKAVKSKVPVQELDALSPDHDPAETVAALKRRWKGDRIALVGHEPDLGALVAYLVDAENRLEFKKGGMCRIDVSRGRTHPTVRLVWFMPPSVLRRVER